MLFGQIYLEEGGEEHLIEDKYILIVGQMHCVIWANIFCNLDEYIALRLVELGAVFLVNLPTRIPNSCSPGTC